MALRARLKPEPPLAPGPPGMGGTAASTLAPIASAAAFNQRKSAVSLSATAPSSVSAVHSLRSGEGGVLLGREERVRIFGVDCVGPHGDGALFRGGEWAPGGEYTQRLRVKNVGTRLCKLKYSLPGTKFFSLPYPEVLVLSPGTTHEVEVTFRPLRDDVYDDSIFFRLLDGPGAGGFNVPVRALLPTLQLALSGGPAADLGFCCVGVTTTHSFQLVNSGQLPAPFAWEAPPPFVFQPASGVVAVEASVSVMLSVRPTEAAVFVSNAVCRVGEGVKAIRPAPLLQMKLCAIAKYPHVEPSEARIDFGSVLVDPHATFPDLSSTGSIGGGTGGGSTAAETVSAAVGGLVSGVGGARAGGGLVKELLLRNRSVVPAAFQIARVESDVDPVFLMEPSAGVIPPQDEVTIRVWFRPASAGTYSSDNYTVSILGGNVAVINVRGWATGPKVWIAKRSSVPQASATPFAPGGAGAAGGAVSTAGTGAFAGTVIDNDGGGATGSVAAAIGLATAGGVPDSVNFGEVQVGCETTRVVRLHNAAARPCRFCFNAEGDGAVFRFSATAGSIPGASTEHPGEADITLRFAPPAPANFYRRVFCLIEDGPVLLLDIMGTGYLPAHGDAKEQRPAPIRHAHVQAFRNRQGRGLGALSSEELEQLLERHRLSLRSGEVHPTGGDDVFLEEESCLRSEMGRLAVRTGAGAGSPLTAAFFAGRGTAGTAPLQQPDIPRPLTRSGEASRNAAAAVKELFCQSGFLGAGEGAPDVGAKGSAAVVAALPEVTVDTSELAFGYCEPYQPPAMGGQIAGGGSGGGRAETVAAAMAAGAAIVRQITVTNHTNGKVHVLWCLDPRRSRTGGGGASGSSDGVGYDGGSRDGSVSPTRTAGSPGRGDGGGARRQSPAKGSGRGRGGDGGGGGGGGTSCFHVQPSSSDIGPCSSVVFQVTFVPTTADAYVVRELEAYVFFKNQRTFRLVKDEVLTPPWCLLVRAHGHSFAGGQLLAKCALSSAKTGKRLNFPPCHVGDATYRTLCITNRGDVSALFRFVIADNDVGGGVGSGDAFSVTPALGLVSPGGFQLVALQFTPQQPGQHRSRLRCILNDSDLSSPEALLLGTGCTPAMVLSHPGGGAPKTRHRKTAEGGMAALVSLPQTIYLKPTCVGLSSSQALTVRNASRVPLVFQVELPPSAAGVLSVRPAIGTLLGNDERALQLSFAPRAALAAPASAGAAAAAAAAESAFSLEVRVRALAGAPPGRELTDTRQVGRAKDPEVAQTLHVAVRAPIATAAVDFDPAEVLLGAGAVAAPTAGSVKLVNNADADVTYELWAVVRAAPPEAGVRPGQVLPVSAAGSQWLGRTGSGTAATSSPTPAGQQQPAAATAPSLLTADAPTGVLPARSRVAVTLTLVPQAQGNYSIGLVCRVRTADASGTAVVLSPPEAELLRLGQRERDSVAAGGIGAAAAGALVQARDGARAASGPRDEDDRAAAPALPLQCVLTASAAFPTLVVRDVRCDMTADLVRSGTRGGAVGAESGATATAAGAVAAMGSQQQGFLFSGSSGSPPETAGSGRRSPMLSVAACGTAAVGAGAAAGIVDGLMLQTTTASLWESLRLRQLNEMLATRLATSDTAGGGSGLGSGGSCSGIGGDGAAPRFAVRFAPAPLGAGRQRLRFELFNGGPLPVAVWVRFPDERDVEVEFWADEGEPTPEQVRQSAIIDRLKVFDVSPRRMVVAPGESVVLSLSYAHRSLDYGGAHSLPLLVAVEGGRRFWLDLDGVTLPSAALEPHWLGASIDDDGVPVWRLEPVPLGATPETAPLQDTWLANAGNGPFAFEVVAAGGNYGGYGGGGFGGGGGDGGDSVQDGLPLLRVEAPGGLADKLASIDGNPSGKGARAEELSWDDTGKERRSGSVEGRGSQVLRWKFMPLEAREYRFHLRLRYWPVMGSTADDIREVPFTVAAAGYDPRGSSALSCRSLAAAVHDREAASGDSVGSIAAAAAAAAGLEPPLRQSDALQGPWQPARLRAERVFVGPVLCGGVVHRVVVLSNTSPSEVVSYRWMEASTSGIVSCYPSSGVLEPGGEALVRVTVAAACPPAVLRHTALCHARVLSSGSAVASSNRFGSRLSKLASERQLQIRRAAEPPRARESVVTRATLATANRLRLAVLPAGATASLPQGIEPAQGGGGGGRRNWGSTGSGGNYCGGGGGFSGSAFGGTTGGSGGGEGRRGTGGCGSFQAGSLLGIGSLTTLPTESGGGGGGDRTGARSATFTGSDGGDNDGIASGKFETVMLQLQVEGEIMGEERWRAEYGNRGGVSGGTGGNPFGGDAAVVTASDFRTERNVLLLPAAQTALPTDNAAGFPMFGTGLGSNGAMFAALADPAFGPAAAAVLRHVLAAATKSADVKAAMQRLPKTEPIHSVEAIRASAEAAAAANREPFIEPLPEPFVSNSGSGGGSSGSGSGKGDNDDATAIEALAAAFLSMGSVAIAAAAVAEKGEAATALATKDCQRAVAAAVERVAFSAAEEWLRHEIAAEGQRLG